MNVVFKRVNNKGTVNSDIFASILFWRIALKDIFATLKIRHMGTIHFIRKQRSDFAISRVLIFHVAFAKKKLS